MMACLELENGIFNVFQAHAKAVFSEKLKMQENEFLEKNNMEHEKQLRFECYVLNW